LNIISSGAIVYEVLSDDINNGEFIEVQDSVRKPVVRKQSGELICFLHCKLEVDKSVIRCIVLKTHVKMYEVWGFNARSFILRSSGL
jgi:hypothetical protein